MIAQGRVGDPKKWGADIPIRVEATYGRFQFRLTGWIHHDRDTGFEARFEGDIASQPVTVFVTSGDAVDGSGTFAAHGVFADSDFSLRGHVSPGSNAAIQGSVSGRRIDLVAKFGSGTNRGPTITGSYDGPAPLLLSILAATLYFL